MPKLRIRDLRPRVGDRKKLLWGKLMNLNLLIYSLKEAGRNIFLLIIFRILDRLLTNNIRESLKKDEFEVLTPPEHNAKRTIVLRNVNSLITTIDNEELKNDLEHRNSWLKVTEIIKISNAPKILKIKAEGSEMDRLACEKGILIYNQSIPPANVDKEIFVYLSPCYKCYKYSHTTDKCPTPDIEVCSECASKEHTFRDCRSPNKKCLNCGEPHRTFAARCPIRRKLIREKTQEIRERSKSRSRNRTDNRSYAQVASVQNQNQTNIQDTKHNREDYVKVVSSIKYSMMVKELAWDFS